MAANTINLKGRPQRREALAAEAITPGHLISYNNAGKFIKHAVAAGNAAPLFAAENEVFGDEISVAYANNDNVLAWMCRAGDEVYALVAAAAAAIVVGDYLESAGDGTLRKVATAAATSQAMRESIRFQALEAVDNSGGGTAVRLAVLII
ncbi:MAG: hypothetical protein AB7L09_21610 [Nitrospira sp.]